jgi:hypothetical protein
VSEETNVEETAAGSAIARRRLIEAGAIAVGAVWVAPVIDSFVTKAAAASGGCSGLGCPGAGSVKLVNGTCAKPCATSNQGACASHSCAPDPSSSLGGYCSGPELTTPACSSDKDCPQGEFCLVAASFCIPAEC